MIEAHEDILLDPRVPAGVPLLESWWWRALVLGVSIGLVPLLIVLWHFIDAPFGEWMARTWPGLLTGFGIVGAPEFWLTGSGIAFLWLAAQRERERAQDAFTLFVVVGVAVLACGFAYAFARGATRILSDGEEGWTCLRPDVRSATIAAAAIWSRSNAPHWSRRLTWMVPLVLAAEIALGTAFAADAIAGAWIGATCGLVVPWVRWRGRDGWMPRRRWSIGVAPSANGARSGSASDAASRMETGMDFENPGLKA